MRETLRKKITGQPLVENDEEALQRQYRCHRGIWNGISLSELAELTDNRRRTCPFHPYTEGLDLETAEELRQEARSRKVIRYLQWTIFITALGIVVTVIVAIMQRISSHDAPPPPQVHVMVQPPATGPASPPSDP
jgi:hypothetical protein